MPHAVPPRPHAVPPRRRPTARTTPDPKPSRPRRDPLRGVLRHAAAADEASRPAELGDARRPGSRSARRPPVVPKEPPLLGTDRPRPHGTAHRALRDDDDPSATSSCTPCARRYPHSSTGILWATGSARGQARVSTPTTGRSTENAQIHRFSPWKLWIERSDRASRPPSEHTVVNEPVDNCGRRASTCGRRRSHRWTTCGENSAAHRACDFPTFPPPLRPHGFVLSDLRKHPFSTEFTAPMTMTKVLSSRGIHTPSSGLGGPTTRTGRRRRRPAEPGLARAAGRDRSPGVVPGSSDHAPRVVFMHDRTCIAAPDRTARSADELPGRRTVTARPAVRGGTCTSAGATRHDAGSPGRHRRPGRVKIESDPGRWDERVWDEVPG